MQRLAPAEVKKLARSQLLPIAIKNKEHLHRYLERDFSKLFFTKDKYIQEDLKIVGPIRLRTIHTKIMENKGDGKSGCAIDTELNICYYDEFGKEN